MKVRDYLLYNVDELLPFIVKIQLHIVTIKATVNY